MHCTCRKRKMCDVARTKLKFKVWTTVSETSSCERYAIRTLFSAYTGTRIREQARLGVALSQFLHSTLHCTIRIATITRSTDSVHRQGLACEVGHHLCFQHHKHKIKPLSGLLPRFSGAIPSLLALLQTWTRCLTPGIISTCSRPAVRMHFTVSAFLLSDGLILEDSSFRVRVRRGTREPTKWRINACAMAPTPSDLKSEPMRWVTIKP